MPEATEFFSNTTLTQTRPTRIGERECWHIHRSIAIHQPSLRLSLNRQWVTKMPRQTNRQSIFARVANISYRPHKTLARHLPLSQIVLAPIKSTTIHQSTTQEIHSPVWSHTPETIRRCTIQQTYNPKTKTAPGTVYLQRNSPITLIASWPSNPGRIDGEDFQCTTQQVLPKH